MRSVAATSIDNTDRIAAFRSLGLHVRTYRNFLVISIHLKSTQNSGNPISSNTLSRLARTKSQVQLRRNRNRWRSHFLNSTWKTPTIWATLTLNTADVYKKTPCALNYSPLLSAFWLRSSVVSVLFSLITETLDIVQDSWLFFFLVLVSSPLAC